MLLLGAHHIRVAVPGGEIILGIDPKRIEWANKYVPILVACIFIVVVGTGLAVGLSTAKRALEPLARTTSALMRLGDGDFQVEPVSTQDPSELGGLARAYNRAVESVRKAFAERDRTEYEMQQFVADAGHQLRTPLTVIMGHLSALSLRASDPRTEAALENMLTESRRMRDLIEDLIVLARLEESNGATDRIDLRAAVLEFAGARSTSGDPKIQLGALDGGNVKVSTSEIHGALTSLADNAAKYAPNSPVEIDLRSIDSTLQLRIMDRGPGMSEGDLDRALDRFYRGQAAANASGSGLGLAIIRRIMERAGGSIDIRNRTGGGLECTLTFPATASTDEFKPP
jgi:two-component system OmpR family sensor kinase